VTWLPTIKQVGRQEAFKRDTSGRGRSVQLPPLVIDDIVHMHLAQPGALGLMIWAGHRPLQHARTAGNNAAFALRLPRRRRRRHAGDMPPPPSALRRACAVAPLLLPPLCYCRLCGLASATDLILAYFLHACRVSDDRHRPHLLRCGGSRCSV
jgi:hypothetical protein